MVLIEKKLQAAKTQEFVKRRRVQRWLQEVDAQHKKVFLFGTGGMGKTTEVCQFAEELYKDRYGYYCLDLCDCEEAQFQAYFDAMLSHAGVVCQIDKSCRSLTQTVDTTKSGITLHEQFALALQVLAKEAQPHLLIFDEVHLLEAGTVLQEFVLFLNYLPENCHVWLLASDKPADEIQTMLQMGTIQGYSSANLALTTEEIGTFLRKNERKLQREKIEDIQQITGGWLGVLRTSYEFIRQRNPISLEPELFENAAWNQYLMKNVWNRLQKQEKAILEVAAYFPYINTGFLTQILHLSFKSEQLVWLERSGLLTYELEHGRYEISTFMRRFCRYNQLQLQEIRDHLLLEAAHWYETEKCLTAVLYCLSHMADLERLSRYMLAHISDMQSILTAKEIEGYLRMLPGEIREPGLWYLMGVSALRTEQYELGEQLEQMLLMWIPRAEEKEKRQGVELLLNLFFVDPRISALEWLHLAEEYIEEYLAEHSEGYSEEYSEEKLEERAEAQLEESDQRIVIEIYSFSGARPSIRCGTKDLTPFFTEGEKVEQTYRRRFSKIVTKEQLLFFDLAEMEYLLDTDRAKQALENLQTMLADGGAITRIDELLGLLGILCQLQRRQLVEDTYEELVEYLMKNIRKAQSPLVLRNAIALRMYTESCGQAKDRLNHWMQYHAIESALQFTYETAYEQLIKAKSYMNMNQYKKAAPLFQRASVYFKRKNQPKYLAESLFGQGVALYAMDQKTDALKIITQGLTLGIKYRYIAPYTEYGQQGLEAIELYQTMIAGNQKNKVTARKKYYYGNILRASYEEYEGILYRSAKKAARATTIGSAHQKDQLTMTEQMILKYIADGRSNQEIGDEMHVKLTTVKTHVSNIFRKLEVKSRVEAVKCGKEIGIV